MFVCSLCKYFIHLHIKVEDCFGTECHETSCVVYDENETFLSVISTKQYLFLSSEDNNIRIPTEFTTLLFNVVLIEVNVKSRGQIYEVWWV